MIIAWRTQDVANKPLKMRRKGPPHILQVVQARAQFPGRPVRELGQNFVQRFSQRLAIPGRAPRVGYRRQSRLVQRVADSAPFAPPRCPARLSAVEHDHPHHQLTIF